MTDLHITQTQWDAVTDGCPVLVVAGDECDWCKAAFGELFRHCWHRTPPAEFVAAANGKCETCGGCGDIDGRNIGSVDVCHVCHGTGRPQITLTVNLHTKDCQANGCCDAGKRTVGTVTITAVVPVVDVIWRPCLFVNFGKDGGPGVDLLLDDREIYCLEKWLPALAPNGPDSIVGHYALILDDLRPA